MERRVILIGMESTTEDHIKRLVELAEKHAYQAPDLKVARGLNKHYFASIDDGYLGADPIQEENDCVASGDCKNDHGERTNYKLRDQPFYARGRNGKMKRF